jgi:predicted O-methyltransferase YrrM
MRIDSLVIDSTKAFTELCELGMVAQSDKSPYNKIRHRHPYTAVYSMLFSQFKHAPIRFAEIGIAAGCSAQLWSQYFKHPDTKLHYFDIDENLFAPCQENLCDTRVTTTRMDVSLDGDVKRALTEFSEVYDVILDDSSHIFEHQIRIIHEAFPLLKSGGLLIIEDIYRNASEKDYAKALANVLEECAAAYFVVCDHEKRWSPGYDNDKILVLVKGN